MGLILFTLEYPPDCGGVARYLETLANMSSGPMEVRRVKLAHLFWPRWLPTFCAMLLARSHPTIWVSHIHPLGSAALLVHLLRGLSYVVVLHGMDFHLGTRNSWKRWLTRQILRNAHLVICNSSVLAREVSQFDQYLVPVVVRPTLPKAMERLLDIPRVISTLSPIRLLTVGRLVQRKNHEIIIRALSDLPEVVHTVIGRGPEEAKIRARAEELGVSGRLRLLTECSDDEVVQEWAGADIFVFLPRSTKEDVEGFGIVYLEAAAAGLPIIASDEEAIGEALDPEGSVRLSSTDPTSLVAAINMLALDPVKRQKMGEANRDFVKKNFLATRIKDELARYVL